MWKHGKNEAGLIFGGVVRWPPSRTAGSLLDMQLVPALSLASALIGIVGTGALFFTSYTARPFIGAVFGSPEIWAKNEKIAGSNRRNRWWQLTGFGLLCVSFALQALAAVLS